MSKIKELKWKNDGRGRWKSDTAFGEYRIIQVGGEYRLHVTFASLAKGGYRSYDEAQEDAQRDFEKRIEQHLKK